MSITITNILTGAIATGQAAYRDYRDWQKAEDKLGDLIRVSIDIPLEASKILTASTSFPEGGEEVIVIGRPVGLGKTVPYGVLSATREIPGYGKIIQLTALTFPGLSGSPVVNMKGEVSGVSTFIISIKSQNITFATQVDSSTRLFAEEGQTPLEWEEWRVEKRLAYANWLYSVGLQFFLEEDYGLVLAYFEEATGEDANYADAYFEIGYIKHKTRLS